MSLHAVTEEVRSVVKWASITLGIILLSYVLFKGGVIVKNIIFPPQLPPPTVAFGKLPQLLFPENASSQTFSYKLNTTTGALPVFADRIKVYELIKPQPSLNALKKAREKVASVGFERQPTRLVDTLYQWSTQNPPFKFLALDILSFNFELSSQFLSDQTVLAGLNLPSEAEAIESARAFLSKMGALYTDFDDSKTKTNLLGIRNSELVPATSFSNSQIIQVDFYQKNIDTFPIFYPKPPFSTMSLLVASGEREGDIVRGNFSHQSISNSFATYPIKTSDEAFQILQKGNAYIASYYGASPQILITNVFLGYYLDEKIQNYLIPIIIFEGNDGFFAYVEAIKDEWIIR